jgi:hypothetical protein
MPDAFVYYFLTRDRSSGRLVSSKRRATLEAIKSRGEPLLESEMTVDDSEVDASGFLVGRSVGRADPADELWGEIRSLRLRARARERQAKQLNDDSDDARKLVLGAESRELRSRADRLQRLIRATSERTSGQGLQTIAPYNAAGRSEFFKPE